VNGGLRSKRSRMLRSSEEVDPMEGTTNIVDAMLVFACGLLLALAVYWNIDLGPIGERVDLEQGREVTDTPEIRKDLFEAEGQGELYLRVGTVYKDPDTGQLFMLTEGNSR
jgi:hypothetical protein